MGLAATWTKAARPAAPLVPTRRLAMHPYIAQRLTIDHDAHGAVVRPLGSWLDLSQFWPVTALVDIAPPASKEERDLAAYRARLRGRVGLEPFHGQTVIGLLDRGTAVEQLLVLTATGFVFYLEPGDLADLIIHDITDQGGNQ